MKDRIYVLVEGEDDRKFFRNIFEPILKGKYATVFYWTYANEKKEIFERVIDSIHSDEKDYFIIGDLNDQSIICYKKDQVMTRSNNKANRRNIIIIVTVLEGWYLAGLTDDDAERFNIHINLSQTNSITINDFNQLQITNVNLFKSITLQHFNYDVAKKRNVSFNYFHTRITTEL